VRLFSVCALAAVLAVTAIPVQAQSGTYRCAGPDGKRLTRDKEDIRVGEECVELTRQEVAKMKAEAVRPPTKAEEASMTSRAQKMEYWNRCVEAGSLLRRSNLPPRQQFWADAVLQQATDIKANDQGYIRERRIRIGMTQCAVVAALGRPSAVNNTHTARSQTSQMVYRDRGIYVYTDNGIVRSWQD